jgi:DNA-damage-inducible protein J
VRKLSEVTNLSVKIDRALKAEADKLFNEMGMSLTTAINVFVRQAVLEQAIPFRIHRNMEPMEEKAAVGLRRSAIREDGADGSVADPE